jgi:hypothetical protein
MGLGESLDDVLVNKCFLQFQTGLAMQGLRDSELSQFAQACSDLEAHVSLF